MTITPDLTPVSGGHHRSRVTVLIPVFNGANFIADTLVSLREQTFGDYEVWCLDDCSTDTSRDIVASFVAADPRVKMFVSETNQGSVPPVINAVLDRIESEFLAYSSQDDQFSPDWLQRMVERADATGADAVLPDVTFVDSTISNVNTMVGLNGDRSVTMTNKDAVIASLDWTIHGWALWRSNIVKQHRYADFSTSADEFSTRRFFLSCNKIVFAETTFFSRQDNPEAITKKPTFRLFELPRTSLAVYDLLADNDFPQDVCATQLLRSINSLIGMCRFAIGNADRFPPLERQRSQVSIRKSFASLPFTRLAPLILRYRSSYKPRTWVKLWLFAISARPLRALTIFQLGRGVRPTDLSM